MTDIHTTAVIDPAANIADDVTIGPYSVVGANVSIGQGTTIGSHCIIENHTTIGKNNRISHHVCLGQVPQDLKYNGEPATLLIGDNNSYTIKCSIFIPISGTIINRAKNEYVISTK